MEELLPNPFIFCSDLPKFYGDPKQFRFSTYDQLQYSSDQDLS